MRDASSKVRGRWEWCAALLVLLVGTVASCGGEPERDARAPRSQFDAPAGELNCERRNSTTSAPQSLTLLNSEFVRKQAGAQVLGCDRQLALAVGNRRLDNEKLQVIDFIDKQFFRFEAKRIITIWFMWRNGQTHLGQSSSQPLSHQGRGAKTDFNAD